MHFLPCAKENSEQCNATTYRFLLLDGSDIALIITSMYVTTYPYKTTVHNKRTQTGRWPT